MMTMTLPDTNASLTHRHSHQTSIISNVNEQFVHNHGAQAAKAAHCEIAVWHEFGTSTTATAAAATSQQQQQHHSGNIKITAATATNKWGNQSKNHFAEAALLEFRFSPMA